jgi:uncharacterized damage-inducible protein DinB
VTVAEARRLLDYVAWANARVFAAAEALTPEELDAPIASSFPSVHATVAHLVEAEWIWLRRWRGDVPDADPLDWEAAPLSDLARLLAALETERSAFFAPLADEDLERPISYRGADGRSFTHPLADLLRHVVHHAAYHRGQLVTLLRQLGKTPPSTDYTRFLRGE